MNFRATVLEAVKHRRGHIQWAESVTRKTRSSKRYYSEFTLHQNRDAILRRVGKKSWEITLPSGTTFRKQEDSHGFQLVKTTPLKPKGYAILLKKRSCPRTPENSPNALPSNSSTPGMTAPPSPDTSSSPPTSPSSTTKP